jgi:hypothetical protein
MVMSPRLIDGCEQQSTRARPGSSDNGTSSNRKLERHLGTAIRATCAILGLTGSRGLTSTPLGVGAVSSDIASDHHVSWMRHLYDARFRSGQPLNITPLACSFQAVHQRGALRGKRVPPTAAGRRFAAQKHNRRSKFRSFLRFLFEIHHPDTLTLSRKHSRSVSYI